MTNPLRYRFVLRESFDWYTKGVNPDFGPWLKRLLEEREDEYDWYLADSNRYEHAERPGVSLAYEKPGPGLRVLTVQAEEPDATYLADLAGTLTQAANPAYRAPLASYSLPEAQQRFEQAPTLAARELALWQVVLLLPSPLMPPWPEWLARVLADFPTLALPLLDALAWAETDEPVLAALQARLAAEPAVAAALAARRAQAEVTEEALTISYSAPDWLPALAAAPWAQALGLRIFDQAELRQHNPPAATQPPPELVCIGGFEPTEYKGVYLHLRRAAPQELYYAFEPIESPAPGDPDVAWLRVPVAPTEAELRAVHERYVAPAAQLPPVPLGAALLAGVAHPGSPVELTRPGLRRLRLVVGTGSWDDDMVGLENALVFNHFLHLQAYCQATAQYGDQDRVTQHATAFSGSLVSLSRQPNTTLSGEAEAVFEVEVQYVPAPHAELLRQWQPELAATRLPPDLPTDLPLDVLGFLVVGDYPIYWSAGALRATLAGGTPFADLAGPDAPAETLAALALLVPDAELATELAPYATTTDEELAARLVLIAAGRGPVGAPLLAAVRRGPLAHLAPTEESLLALAAPWANAPAPPAALRTLAQGYFALLQQQRDAPTATSRGWATQLLAYAQPLHEQLPNDDEATELYANGLWRLVVEWHNQGRDAFDQSDYSASLAAYTRSCELAATYQALGYELPQSFTNMYLGNLADLCDAAPAPLAAQATELLARYEDL